MKMRLESLACEETELDQFLEKIIDKVKFGRRRKPRGKEKRKGIKEAAEEHRQSAMEHLTQHLYCLS